MHPIVRAGKVWIYLLSWLPVAYALGLILVAQSRLSWVVGAALSGPLCLVYAFVCLSAWYVCLALPLRREHIYRLLVSHLSSALGVSGLWTALAKGLFLVFALKGSIDPVLPSVFAMGLVLYLLAVSIHYVLIAVEASQEAQAREAEARVLAGEAELRALKAQINPHFLFNSLHSISALTSIDGARAREMCVLLSGFLRSTLGLGEKSAIPLEEELTLVRSYLAIEKVRFGSRLQVEEAIAPECAGDPVPPLLLQPLVENAVIHGIADLVEPGFIRISAHRNADDGLTIAVENSFDGEAPSRRHGGFGLASVRKRLLARYGDTAQLAAGPGDRTYRVELRLPPPEENS